MALKAENAATSNVDKYNIDNYEYFENVVDIPPVPKTIKAYIAKYMPHVSKGDWKKPYSISIQSNQVNDKECVVQMPTSVLRQGYVTLEHYPNEHPDFTEKAVEKDGRLVVKKGNKFMAEVLYNDSSDIKFIGKV